MALLREKRSAVHDFLLHTAASSGDIGMVCGGDVTAHFQFIPAEDASWQALASALTERLTAHQRGWLVLREDGGCGALLGAGGSAVGEIFLRAWSPPPSSRLHPAGAACSVCPCPSESGRCCSGRATSRRPCVPPAGNGGLPPGGVRLPPGAGHPQALPHGGGDHLRGLHLHQGPPHGNGGGLRGHHDQRPYARLPCGGTSPPWAVCLCGGHRLPHQDRLREPEAAGAGIPEESIAQIHTPIGTAIQAVTPAKIAVSIAGEMILCRAERRGDKPHGCPMH